MSIYLGSTGFNHQSPERLGVLLINLGTPDAPDTDSVRRYLNQFLSDPRVIEYPRWLWWLVLHGVILRIRPRKSAHAYQQIWTSDGSPLLAHTLQLGNTLHATLRHSLHAEVQLAVGMTYGKPSIRTALEQLRQANVRRLLVLPLYPQYSGSTTGSAFDAVTGELRRWRWTPELRFINNYCDDQHYIHALADSIRTRWQSRGQQHLLLSFHGLPKRYLMSGDPYFCHCHKTARLVAEQLGLNQDQWSISFQSRVGREEWLRPYTDEHLLQLVARGTRRVTVACPAFATDCLETLEEIALRNRDDFLRAGGEMFDYVPALNATDAHVHALEQLVLCHAQGWPALLEHRDSAALAQQLGAPQ
jgi:protoporphyrin/coproporphyrin ferrochelatase